MNEVYLDKNGKVFINGHEIENVQSISTKTSWLGTNIVIEFKGDYKSDYVHKEKKHSLDECSKE